MARTDMMDTLRTRATKRVRTPKRAVESPPAAATVSAEQRRRMIAEAAYYRAVARNFQGGDPVNDWLTAEHEVDQRLARARVEETA